MMYVKKPEPFKSTKHPYSHFKIDFKLTEKGKRKRKLFKTYEKACEEYEILERELRLKQSRSNIQADEGDVIKFISANKLASKLETSPEAIFEDYLKAAEILHAKFPGKTLLEMAYEYRRWRKLNNPHISLEAASKEFFAYLDNTSSRRSKDGGVRHKQFIERFVSAFGPETTLFDVKPEKILDFIYAQKGRKGYNEVQLMPGTQLNIWKTIRMFFKFCKAQKFIDEIPIRKSKPEKRDEEPVIYTPLEVRQLLDASDHDSELTLYIAIAAFTGIRDAEIRRLKWTDFHMDCNEIILSKEITKTYKRRNVLIMDNLRAWLNRYSNKFYKDEYILPFRYQLLHNRLLNIGKETGIEIKTNAFRHSCASYYLALTQSKGKTSNQLGHSIAVLTKYYMGLVGEPEAKEYYNIYPY